MIRMDWKGILFITAGCAALALSAAAWEFAAVALVIALVQKAGLHRQRQSGDSKLLAYAKSLEARHSRQGLLRSLAESSRCDPVPAAISSLSLRAMYGGIGPCQFNASGSRSAIELATMIDACLCNGASMKGSISRFISRLQAELELRNRMLQSSLAMDALSGLGLSIFVPMFGGIGASIISASGSIIGSGAYAAVLPFEAVIVIYVAVMSYTASAFGGASRGAASALQSAITGAAIIRIAAALTTNAI